MHFHRSLGSSRAVKFAVAIVIPLTTMGVFAATGGVASAGNPPVRFLGTISCGLTGTATFNPPMTNTAQGSVRATFKGKTAYCKGVNGTKLTQGGATLKSSSATETYKFTIPAHTKGACSDLTTSHIVPAITGGVVTWLGTASILPTNLSFAAGTVNPTGLFTYATGTSTGSFSGPGETSSNARLQMQASKIGSPTTTKLLPYSQANVTFVCSSHGISSIEFLSPKDIEESGPAA